MTTEKKDYKPRKDFADAATHVKQLEHIVPNPLEHEVRTHKTVGCMHHDMVWLDPANKKAHQYFTKAPILASSAIVCTTDEKTRKWSLCLYVDFFRNWPERDPEGQALLDSVEGDFARYCAAMDTPEYLELKKKLLKGTKQYEAKAYKTIDEAMQRITMESRLKSPVLWAEYGDDHAQAGQVDKSKSPYFIMKLWETELKGEAGEADLIVNLAACPQKIFTKIYDRTVNFHAPVVSTEEAFANLVYHKGSTKLGKQMFRLNIQPCVMSMTAYFPMEKRGDCQYKCSLLNATKKIPVASNYGMSATEEEKLMADMMAFEAATGLHQGATGDGPGKRALNTEHGEGPEAQKAKTGE